MQTSEALTCKGKLESRLPMPVEASVRSPTGKYGPIARTAEEIFARAAGR